MGRRRLLLILLLAPAALVLVAAAGSSSVEIDAQGGVTTGADDAGAGAASASGEQERRIPMMQALAVMRYLRAAEEEMNSLVAAAAGFRQPLEARPPPVEKQLGAVSGCLASLRKRSDPRPFLQSLLTLWPPLEDGGEESELRPPREAALLELSLNASIYWGIEALWGIFDPIIMPLASDLDINTNKDKQQQPPKAKVTDRPPTVPVPTLEWHPPTGQCGQAVDSAVGMQGRGDIGFYEIWSEDGPLGNPLQKRMEGAFHDHGPRTCMGHGRKIVNTTDGRLSAFGLALCSDNTPVEGMVASGVIKNLGSTPVCAVTIHVLQLPPYWQDEATGVSTYDFEAFPPPPPKLLTEWRLEGYLPPQGFFVLKVQVSKDFPPQGRYAVGILGSYFPCLPENSRKPDFSRPLAWAPMPGGSAFAPKVSSDAVKGEDVVDYSSKGKGKGNRNPHVKGGRGTKRPEEGASIVEGVGEFLKGAVGGVWGRITGRGQRR